MIVNGGDKLKSWAGLVCLFSKWNIMQTNLPCKQVEKTGNVATPRPPPPKKKNDRPKAPKGPQQQGEKKEKGKKNKNGFAYCPATEEVQSNQKQAEGTASSLIKRWFCLLSRYWRGAKQPKTGWRHRIILDKKVDLLIVPLPKWFNATKNWLKAPPHPEWV